MIDSAVSALNTMTQGSPVSIALAFGAGIATSVGPCAAQRYIAIASLLDSEGRSLAIAAFAGGLLLTSIALGFGADALVVLSAQTDAVYAILASGLAIFGFATLLRPVRPCRHAIALPGQSRARTSGGFALGTASAFVVSPCCTPVIAAVASTGFTARNPLLGMAVIAAFSLGHLVPVVVAARFGGAFVARIRLHPTAAATVSGTLMLALASYYALIA